MILRLRASILNLFVFLRGKDDRRCARIAAEDASELLEEVWCAWAVRVFGPGAARVGSSSLVTTHWLDSRRREYHRPAERHTCRIRVHQTQRDL